MGICFGQLSPFLQQKHIDYCFVILYRSFTSYEINESTTGLLRPESIALLTTALLMPYILSFHALNVY